MALLILPCGQAARETDRLAVPLPGEAVHVRAARVGQVEETPDLVEGLAGRIVQGPAELDDIRRDVPDLEDVRVPTRDDEADKVLGQRPFGELIDREVADHVVDAVQGLAQGRGQGLRRADTNSQRTDEARSSSDRDRVDVRKGDTCLVERGVQRRQEGLKVRARSDLGDDAAVARVLIHRRRRTVDEQLRATHEADAGLIAG